MNLTLRTKILKHSLELEEALNKILIRLIKVKSKEPKTLGHKSSAISFGVKANLLYDLGRITKDEYNLLFCFMEIRNQFVHNLDADSFDKVIERINKKKLFLNSNDEFKSKLDKETDSNKKEKIYRIIYDSFYAKLLKLIINQYESLIKLEEQDRISKINKEFSEIQKNMFKLLTASIDEGSEIFGGNLDEALHQKNRFGKVLKKTIKTIYNKKLREAFPDLFKEKK